MRQITALLTAFMLILVIGVSCSKSEQALTSAELLDFGEKYLLELNYEQALVQFLAVIEIEPMNPRGYIGAAEAYVGLGRVNEAIEVLRTGLHELTGNVEIRAMLDRLMLKQESTSIATPEFGYKPESENGDVLRKYSYSDFSYTFEWEENWGTNEGAVGGCLLDFIVAGDISGIDRVLIAAGSPMPPWTNDDIVKRGNWVIPLWKDSSNSPSGGFDGHVIVGFPIMPDELGVFGEVLLFVLDAECIALGHIIVYVQIPNSII